MLTLSTRKQITIGTGLTLLMAITRGHHVANLEYLSDASWAVFFLAGFYLKPAWWFPALFALGSMIDFAAITWGGVSSFCVSPAYLFLLPAYASLWFAGRWYARHYRFTLSTIFTLAGSVLIGATLCELISSGSFYFFSGRFSDTSIVEFGTRLVQYFPADLQSVTLYIGMAAIIHILFKLASTKNVANRMTL